MIIVIIVSYYNCYCMYYHYIIMSTITILFQYVQQSIKNITEDLSNYKMAYVNHEDICNCFQGDTLLAIQAPSGTQLEVPIPNMVGLIPRQPC